MLSFLFEYSVNGIFATRHNDCNNLFDTFRTTNLDYQKCLFVKFCKECNYLEIYKTL